MQIVYNLKEGVQVRNEKFGLLFYNYRGPRLYFVPSSNLMDAVFFSGKTTAGNLVEKLCNTHSWPRHWIEAKVKQVLNKLENKGLIYGESLC